MTTGSLIGLLAALPTVAANAQTTAAAETADATIVVTARKREESLVEVPLAVTTFSQDDIESRGVNTLADLSAFTPGFDFQETGQGGASGRDNPSIRFRGVAVQNENPASRAGAVFFNGSYLSGGAGLLPTFDLQRVEIIKGPQNALYGRNTFAGAVNFLPQEPGDEFEGFVNGLYSPTDQDTYQIQGAVTIPLTENLGVRIGAQYRRAGADFTFTNGDPLGTEETTSLQGTLVYDNKNGVKLKTTGYWVDASDTRATVNIPGNSPPGTCDLTFSGEKRNVVTGELTGSFTTDLSQSTRTIVCGQVPDYDAPGGFQAPAVGNFEGNTVPLDPFSGSIDYIRTLPPEADNYAIPNAPNGNGNTYNTWLINQSGEFDIPGDHTLSLVFSYGQNGSYRVRDSQDGALGANQRLTAFAFYSHDLFAEARVASPADQRIRYQFGFSYYSGASRTFEFSPFAGATFFGPAIDDQALTFIDSDVFGVFGTVDFDVTSDITLSLEGRYGTDKITTVYNGPTLRDFGPSDPLPEAVRNVSQSFTKFMPRVSLQYNPNDQLNIYANWAISYLQGSDTNVLDYAAAVPSAGLDPATFGFITPVQRLNAFEVGVKAQPMPNLNLAVAGFYMDWENQVQFELSPGTFVPLFSAGDSRYKGIEAEANYTPAEWLRLEGNVTYVDAELTDFAGAGSLATAVLAPGQLGPGEQISSNGNRPRYIPKWSSALAGTIRFNKLLDFDKETFLRVDAVYFGDIFLDNFEFNEVPGYWKFNARLSSQLTDMIRLDLYGLNLTNDLSFSSAGGETAGPGGSRRTFGGLPRARELGLEVFVRF
ncbi:MAG: TonB-dependent receptor [Polymorphobacter sp.]|uniref:TonB-dependent receptor n=1 Tax=Polymorphobacter sp. TaxID=1909290 RepID=UPI003A893F71